MKRKVWLTQCRCRSECKVLAVHKHEPVWNSDEKRWVNTRSGNEPICPLMYDLRSGMRRNGILSWYPKNRRECVEVVLNFRRDGAIILDDCGKGHAFFGLEHNRPYLSFDAEYVCTWLPIEGGKR